MIRGVFISRLAFWSAFMILAVACNLPLSPPKSPPVSSQEVVATGTPPPPTVTMTTAPAHKLIPADVSPSGTVMYDVESSGTASQNRAPYGDAYNINRFERPFTSKDMIYLPDLDIVTFRMGQDGGWYYPFIKLIGNNPNDPLNIDYGIEIDKDRDGDGEVLIWAHPPFSTEWSTQPVQVFNDTNHDTGGGSALSAEVASTGDGYDMLVFDGGQGKGDDPDLAWVRINPSDPTMLEFAFKKILGGVSFMWSAVADAGLKDPGKFYYNDRYTIEQAGSPLTDNPFYPIKEVYAVDNTCRAAFGFEPMGTEPLLCSFTAPTATKAPRPPSGSTPGVPPPQGCQPPAGGCFGWMGEPICQCAPE